MAFIAAVAITQFSLMVVFFGMDFWQYETSLNFLLEIGWLACIFVLANSYTSIYRRFSAGVNNWNPNFIKELSITSQTKRGRIMLILETAIPLIFILLSFILYFHPFLLFFDPINPEGYFLPTRLDGSVEQITTPGMLSFHWISGTFLHLIVYFLSIAFLFFLAFFLDFTRRVEKMTRKRDDLASQEFFLVNIRRLLALDRGVAFLHLPFLTTVAFLGIIYVIIVKTPYTGVFYSISATFLGFLTTILVIRNHKIAKTPTRYPLSKKIVMIAIENIISCQFPFYRMYWTGNYNEADFFALLDQIRALNSISKRFHNRGTHNQKKLHQSKIRFDGLVYYFYEIFSLQEEELRLVLITGDRINSGEIQEILPIFQENTRALPNTDSPQMDLCTSIQQTLDLRHRFCLAEDYLLTGATWEKVANRLDLKLEGEEDPLLEAVLAGATPVREFIDFSQDDGEGL